MDCKINEEEIPDYNDLSISIKQYENISNKRNFIWHSSDFSVINCENFFRTILLMTRK